MSVSWTAEQVLALAPDASSTKSGSDLATPRKWVSLGQAEHALWGECQGSGANPYQTQIDLREPAFKCSCPSRKFPCKHALGLFLLFVNQPNAFSRSQPPQWVTDWLTARDKRAEKAAEKKEARTDKHPDTAAQAKRAAQRENKVKAGLQELDIWLSDLVRTGLANVQTRPYSFWESIAARMVDAQAPGIARMLKQMAEIPATGDGWQERLLGRIAMLHLLLEGYKRIDALSEEAQSDIKSLIGWTQDREDILAKQGIRDRWFVAGQRAYEEDRLRVQRTWLWGQESRRAALILDFSHISQPISNNGLIPGSWIDAELVFFPGSYPIRALIKDKEAAHSELEAAIGFDSIKSALKTYSSVLAVCPWAATDAFPVVLHSANIINKNGRWIITDSDGCIMPVSRQCRSTWQILSISGGHKIGMMGEWDGEFLLPLAVWTSGRFYNVIDNDY